MTVQYYDPMIYWNDATGYIFHSQPTTA